MWSTRNRRRRALVSADAAVLALERRSQSLPGLITDTVDGLTGSFAEARITVRTELTDVLAPGGPVGRGRSLLTGSPAPPDPCHRAVLSPSGSGDRGTGPSSV